MTQNNQFTMADYFKFSLAKAVYSNLFGQLNGESATEEYDVIMKYCEPLTVLQLANEGLCKVVKCTTKVNESGKFIYCIKVTDVDTSKLDEQTVNKALGSIKQELAGLK